MSFTTQRTRPGFFHTPDIAKLEWRRVLLACGVAATVLYFGMDVLASILYSGYSYTDQTISELSAVGAPTRSLWISLGFAYAVLTIAGSMGIWSSAGERHRLRYVAAFVAAIGILGLVAWPFAPMHQREVLAAGNGTLTDTMHLVLSGADTLFFMLSICVGATAFGSRFRLYSFATLGLVLVAGFITAMDAPKVSANEATPWVGIAERIAVFGSMFWIAALALGMLRESPKGDGPVRQDPVNLDKE